MKTKNIFILFVFATMLISCGPTINVVSDYDTTTDFNNIETYKIIYDTASTKSNIVINDLNKERIDRYLKSDLQMKGLRENNNNPDVIIKYTTNATIETEISTNGSISGSGYGRIGYRSGYASGTRTATIENNTIGTLKVEMIDNETGKMIWYAAGTKEVVGNSSGEKAEKAVKESVSQIMSKFPVNKLVASTK